MFRPFLPLFLLLLLFFGLTSCSAPKSPVDVVRIRWVQDPETLDPLSLPNSYAQEALDLLHLSLLTFDTTKGILLPWLAEAMPAVQHSDSLTLFSYHLRAGARWDNGQPVLARDVAFTLKAMNCPGLPNEAMQARVDFIIDIELDPTDPTHFTLICHGRSPEYLQDSGSFFILPEYALDPQGSLRRFSLPDFRHHTIALLKDPVITAFAGRYRAAELAHQPANLPGCGPYRLAKWQNNQALLFERKKNWWADQFPVVPKQLQAHPRQIDYQIIPDPTTALLALQQGAIDVYPMLPARDFKRLQHSKANQTLALYTSNSYEVVTAGFNTARPLLRDKLTRRALSHLFNVPALIKATQEGIAQPSVGLINPNEQHYYNDSLALLTYDLAGAAVLLRQAGWIQQPDSTWQRPTARGTVQKLALRISYRAADPVFEQIALQFRNAAATLGVPVSLRPTEASLMTSQLRVGNFDMYIRSLAGGPTSFNFMPILHSQSIGSNNYTGFNNPDNDRLIEAIAFEEDPARKIRMLRKFQALLQEESPLITLFFLTYRLAASRQLANLHPSAIKPGYDVMSITAAAPSAQHP